MPEGDDSIRPQAVVYMHKKENQVNTVLLMSVQNLYSLTFRIVSIQAIQIKNN